MKTRICIFQILLVGLLTCDALCQEGMDVDHAAVLELGGAGEWNIGHPSSQFGGTIALEVTPVEHWLEIEFGGTAFNSSGQTEVDGDLLFKKPFTISHTVEFMVGFGPEFIQRFGGAQQGDSFGAEFDLDFMFWPTNNVGWYLEPGYDKVFGTATE